MPDRAPGTLLRLAAFTTDPAGGNPAGVWIGDAMPSDAEMQRIAAEVGYSETAFVVPDGSGAPGHYRVRYFSVLAEVPFCGHATIASAVALAERGLSAESSGRDGSSELVLATNGGPVAITVATGPDGLPRATLTSVAPRVTDAGRSLIDDVLALLGWTSDELDPDLPPAMAFAGAQHLILAVRGLETLARLSYPFDAMRSLMLGADLTTLQLVWREAPDRFRARNPFPVGGVVEDPATGAAAAALGAYLRVIGMIRPPASFEIVQGLEMGRPSRLTVSIVPGEAGVRVSGNAVPVRS